MLCMLNDRLGYAVVLPKPFRIGSLRVPTAFCLFTLSGVLHPSPRSFNLPLTAAWNGSGCKSNNVSLPCSHPFLGAILPSVPTLPRSRTTDAPLRLCPHNNGLVAVLVSEAPDEVLSTAQREIGGQKFVHIMSEH